MYAVTAKHVIDGVKNRHAVETVVLTYNGRDGIEEREIPIDQWAFHPNPGADYVDVAVARFDYDFSVSEPHFINPHQVRYWKDHSFYGHRSPSIPNYETTPLALEPVRNFI